MPHTLTTQPATIVPGATLALALATGQDEVVDDEAAPPDELPAAGESVISEASTRAETSSEPSSAIGQGEGMPGATNAGANGGLGNPTGNRTSPGLWLVGLGLLLVVLGAGLVIFLRSR